MEVRIPEDLIVDLDRALELTDESNRNRFESWLRAGKGIAIYLNQALDSSACGDRISVTYGAQDTQIPDDVPGKTLPVGVPSHWAYQLEAVVPRPLNWLVYHQSDATVQDIRLRVLEVAEEHGAPLRILTRSEWTRDILAEDPDLSSGILGDMPSVWDREEPIGLVVLVGEVRTTLAWVLDLMKSGAKYA